MLQGTMAFAAWVAYNTGMFLAINELLKEKTRPQHKKLLYY